MLNVTGVLSLMDVVAGYTVNVPFVGSQDLECNGEAAPVFCCAELTLDADIGAAQRGRD